MITLLRSFAFLAAVVVITGIALNADSAARFRIINLDPPSQGLNDPTPVDPIGGNPGVTLGEQRLNVFLHAAEIWGATLDSDVEITINGSFANLTCTPTSGTLAQTGSRSVSFGAPPPGAMANTWYRSSLANRLAGVDVDPGFANMNITYNSRIGQPGCLDGTSFYLGLDRNHGAGTDLVAVTLHEIAHGLGFGTNTNAQTGAFAGTPPRPSIYDRFIFDKTQGLHWHEMPTNADRARSALNFLNVVWNGPQVTSAVRSEGTGIVSTNIESPPALFGRIPVGTALFGPSLRETQVGGQLAAVTPSIACPEIENPTELVGKIAFIDRGGTDCTFALKTALAQAAGAIGVVVANNQAGLITMAGSDPTITIPVAMVLQSDGQRIRDSLADNVRMRLDGLVSSLDDGGRMYMFTPPTFQAGSTISHFENLYAPRPLMGAAYSSPARHSLDLTVRLFADEGWFFPTGRVNRKVAFYRDGDGLYVLENGSFIGPETRLSDGLTPSWAPYGQRLAVAKVKDTGAVVIALINADGSGEREITSTSGFDFFPVWSPDGNKIAFVRDETGSGISSSLYVIDVEGTNLRRLTRVANVYDLRPTWSPDSAQLMFSRLRPDATRAAIYRINVNGTDEQRITNGTFKDLDPDWAPDGSKVVFASDRFQGRSQIFTMNPDGTGIARLTLTASEEAEPRWSPDSQKIVFISQRKGENQVFVMDREGFKPERITVGVGAEMTPAWQGLP